MFFVMLPYIEYTSVRLKKTVLKNWSFIALVLKLFKQIGHITQSSLVIGGIWPFYFILTL